jgi:T4 RnlA family RNA ligase
MKLHKYLEFIKESKLDKPQYFLPNYEQAFEMCNREDSPFYETKTEVDGFPISIFNYRLAQYSDFVTPIIDKPEYKAYEMRGLTFVFNKDGSLFRRYILLEKFFNLNQVPESMYSIVKNYKIKYINSKEDGSIATFIQLPSGKIVGKSKMGFDNEQAVGINRIYRNNTDIQKLVNWSLQNDIVPIFEYVAPTNRIVLIYNKEELILLRLRDNKTGKHLDLKDHIDKIGQIKIAPFYDDFKDLDNLIELTATEVDKEGYVVQAEDEQGKDFFFKIKTPWYTSLHSLLSDDIYRENIMVKYILEDKIDDILGQIPENQKETHQRIHRIIKVIKEAINKKMNDMDKLYQIYLSMDKNDKEFALKYRKHPEFGHVMLIAKKDKLKKLSREEILDHWGDFENYEKALERLEPYEIAKNWIAVNCNKLEMARAWLKERDPRLFFKDPEENEDNN